MSSGGRKSNWSSAEKELLVELCSTSCISSKFSNTCTSEQKNAFWVDCTEKVNSVGIGIRTKKEVNKKWTETKSETKKRAQGFRKASRQTGGGPAPSPLFEWEEKVVNCLPDSVIDGVVEGGDIFQETLQKDCAGNSQCEVPSRDSLWSLAPNTTPAVGHCLGATAIPSQSTSKATDAISNSRPLCAPKAATEATSQKSPAKKRRKLIDTDDYPKLLLAQGEEKLDLKRQELIIKEAQTQLLVELVTQQKLTNSLILQSLDISNSPSLLNSVSPIIKFHYHYYKNPSFV